MAGDEENKVEEKGSILVARFRTAYNLANEQIKFNDVGLARQGYSHLLKLYNEIAYSDASYIDKQDAYQKLREVHQNIYKPEGTITFGNVIVPITLVLIVLIIVFFVKPQLVGVTGFFVAETNSAPVWASENAEFRISELVELNLDDYFMDENGDKLTYVSTSADNIAVFVAGNTLTLIPDDGITGSRFLTLYASDSKAIAGKQVRIVIE